MTILDQIEEHRPNLTDADDADMDRIFSETDLFHDGIEWADFARRTCRCGVKVDGFYEYVDHLKEVFS